MSKVIVPIREIATTLYTYPKLVYKTKLIPTKVIKHTNCIKINNWCFTPDQLRNIANTLEEVEIIRK